MPVTQRTGNKADCASADEKPDNSQGGSGDDRTRISSSSASSSSSSSSTKQQPKRGGLATAISGSISGMVASAILQPFDVLRTTLQSSAASGQPMHTLQAAQHIFNQGGVSSFWRGTQATVVRLGLGAGLHFFCLESIRGALEQEQPDGTRRLSNLSAMASGGLSRALASALLCPVTVVKTRMENASLDAAARTAAGTGYKDVPSALVTIARTEGAKGLFRGLVPTVLANAPFSAFYYLFYTRLKEQLSPQIPNATAANATSSTIAALGATLLTQPMDVIRTRMQLGVSTPSSTGGSKSSGIGLNSFKTLGKMIRKEGGASIMVGIGPRLVKRTFQSVIVWTLYEELLPKLVALGTPGAALLTSTGGGGGYS